MQHQQFTSVMLHHQPWVKIPVDEPTLQPSRSVWSGFAVICERTVNEVKLTDKQRRFCEEYLVDLNATQAAIRAGYSSKGINKRTTRMMANDGIQQYISELMQEQSKRTEITADKVLQELAAIAFSDRTELAQVGKHGEVNFTPTEQLPNEIKKIIAGIENGKYGTKVTTYDKVKALELLGKHLGMFVTKIEGSISADVNDPFKGLTTEELRKLIDDG